MFDPQIHAVLDTLHSKNALSSKATETRLEKLFKRPAKYLLWSTAVFFVAICLLALCVMLTRPVSAYWVIAAKILLILTNVSGMLWMLADIIPSMIALVFFKNDAHRTHHLEVAHDFRNAADLYHFEPSTLQLTDLWLSIRIERTRLRLGLFLGGSDKIAVLALVLGVWGIWSNFPEQGASWQQYAYVAMSAFLGGLAIGGMLAGVLINRLSYQRDLLSIARSVRVVP